MARNFCSTLILTFAITLFPFSVSSRIHELTYSSCSVFPANIAGHHTYDKSEDVEICIASYPTARWLVWQTVGGKVHRQQKRAERKTRWRYARRSASVAAWPGLAAVEHDLWPLAVHRPPSTSPALCYVVALSREFTAQQSALGECTLKQHVQIPYRHCTNVMHAHTYNHFMDTFKVNPDSLFILVLNIFLVGFWATICKTDRHILCSCVCVSQVSILLQRLNVQSHKQCHTLAQRL